MLSFYIKTLIAYKSKSKVKVLLYLKVRLATKSSKDP
jgi:hypothetical protein